MAKPIRATPTLYGKYAVAFVKKMLAKEKRKPTKVELELAKEVAKDYKFYETVLESI